MSIGRRVPCAGDCPTDALRAIFEANFFGWHDLTVRVIKVGPPSWPIHPRYTPYTPPIHPLYTPCTPPIHPLYTPYTPPIRPLARHVMDTHCEASFLELNGVL